MEMVTEVQFFKLPNLSHVQCLHRKVCDGWFSTAEA